MPFSGVPFFTETRVVDLKQAGIKVNDVTAGAANIAILNTLITTYKALDVPVCFNAPQGDIYIDKAGSNWSVLIQGCRRMTFRGQGKTATVFVQHGTGTGNDWYGWYVDKSEDIAFYDMGFRQGTIKIPSAGQHDHLMVVGNSGAAAERCEKITGSGLFFGQALGDCLAIINTTLTTYDSSFSDITIDGYGFVTQPWAASTAYVLNEQVYKSGVAYICITAGTSASSGGPTGTGADITDGTVHWRGNSAGGVTYRFAARSGISFQRGYDNLRFSNINIQGIQNSGIDMESTGAGALRRAHFDTVFIDNTLGNTATAFSFSGSNVASNTECSANNIKILNGAMQIAGTERGSVTNLTITTTQAFANDPSTPLLVTNAGKDDNGLILDNILLERKTGSGAGNCLSIQGSGQVAISNLFVLQQTDAYPVYVESQGLYNLSFSGKSHLRFAGATPTNYMGMWITALSGNCNRINITGVNISSDTGVLKAAIRLDTRSTFTMDDVSITNCTADPGVVTTGVIFSRQAGSRIDVNPILQGCNFGGATLYTTVDNSDVAITTIFPLISGNKKGVYHLQGTVDPLGNVLAPVGIHYTWVNGSSTHEYIKLAGAGPGGWAQLVTGAPGVSPYVCPSDATAWAAFNADNALTTAAPNRSWMFQEASGNAVAAIGSENLTASGAGILYQQAQSGYDRSPTDYFITLPDGTASCGFKSTAAGLPTPSTTSQFLVVIGSFVSLPAVERTLFMLSTTSAQVRFKTTGGFRVLLVGDDTATASLVTLGTVYCMMVHINMTATTAAFSFDPQEKVPSYISAPNVSKQLSIGGFDNNSPNFKVRAAWHWEGAAAEAFTQTKRRALAVALGGDPLW